MTKPRVFVSHCADDNAITRRVAQDLRAAGASVWVDLDDMGAGNWVQNLNEAFADFDWFVLILSDVALTRPWVLHEVSVAIDMKNAGEIQGLLFIKAGPLDTKNLPKLWRIFQRYDLTRDYDAEMARVYKEVRLAPRVDTNPLASEVVDVPSDRGVLDSLRLEVHHVEPQETRTLDNALAAFDRALAIDPDDLMALNNKGNALNELNRYEEALVPLNRALTIDPSNVLALGNLIYALAELERWNLSLDACERVLTIEPNNQAALVNKGRALYSLNRFREALEAEDRALELDPKDGTAWVIKGAVLSSLERVEKAERRAKALGG